MPRQTPSCEGESAHIRARARQYGERVVDDGVEAGFGRTDPRGRAVRRGAGRVPLYICGAHVDPAVARLDWLACARLRALQPARPEITSWRFFDETAGSGNAQE